MSAYKITWEEKEPRHGDAGWDTIWKIRVLKGGNSCYGQFGNEDIWQRMTCARFVTNARAVRDSD